VERGWLLHGGEGGVLDVRLVRAVVAGCAVVCGVRDPLKTI
jgi:hypothetical protein